MFKIGILLCFFISLVHSKELPPFLRDLRCNRNRDFEKCFLKNGNLAIPLVAKGDPEYNIPKMDPMDLPFIQLISTPMLSMNITDTKVYGLQDLRIAYVRAQQSMTTIMLKAHNITLIGKYAVDGKILIMPIRGSGPFSLTGTNAALKITSSHKKYAKDGVDYYKMLGSRLDYQFENIEFNFENLFDGNKLLGDELNKFLNENWDILIVDFGPGIAETITSIIDNIYNGFTSNVPAENFFAE